MRKLGIISIAILILGCGEKRFTHIYKYKDTYVNEAEIDQKIDSLIRQKNVSEANLYIRTLMTFNAQSGFLYFEKGILEGYSLHAKEALRDLQTAKKLGYDNERCETMIKTTKILLNAINK